MSASTFSQQSPRRFSLADIVDCAGLDIHKDTVVACSRRVSAGRVSREARTFKTTTSELLALSDWLASLGATHIAMEANSVYWNAAVSHAIIAFCYGSIFSKDALDRAIAEVDKEVEANLAPSRELIPVLTGIPGIGELAARFSRRLIGTSKSPCTANSSDKNTATAMISPLAHTLAIAISNGVSGITSK